MHMDLVKHTWLFSS